MKISTETEAPQKKISLIESETLTMKTEGRKKKKKKMKISMEIEGHSLPLSLIESGILPRLPAKSVGVCRCVCKQWKSFLSSPTFVRMHLPYHATIDDYKLLLIYGPIPYKLPLSSTIPSLDPRVRDAAAVVATLDGLVCLAALTGDLLFWNPLTGAYRKLSPIDPDFPFYTHSSSDVFGFYKDESCNDYRLIYLENEGRRGAYIYSHILDTWRPIDFPFAFKSNRDPDAFCSWSPATLLGQCLYFTVTAYYMSMERYTWIICFDVKTETFRKIRFPHVPSTNFRGGLVVLNGSLHLCVTYEVDDYLMHGGMWRMNGDGWVQLAAFSDPGFRQKHICTTTTAGNWLAVLDEKNNSFEKVNAEDFTTRYRCFCSTTNKYRYSRMIYVETLVSPNP